MGWIMSPKEYMLMSWSPELQNVTLFGNRGTADVIKVKMMLYCRRLGPWSSVTGVTERPCEGGGLERWICKPRDTIDLLQTTGSQKEASKDSTAGFRGQGFLLDPSSTLFAFWTLWLYFTYLYFVCWSFLVRHLSLFSGEKKKKHKKQTRFSGF